MVKKASVSLTLLCCFFISSHIQTANAQSGITWFFSWSCINSGCTSVMPSSSGREGPYNSQTQCNSARNQMNVPGINVQSCVSVGSANQTNSGNQPPIQSPAPTLEDMAGVNVMTITSGLEMTTFCGAANGVLKGSTREWYLGCCPSSHPILKSISPTTQCGTEQARIEGLECQCYKEIEFCLTDADFPGICY